MMVVEPHCSSFNNSTSVAASSDSNAATFAGFEFEMLKKYKQRPGRDVRSVVVFSYSSSSPSRISNPGRRSDSPPY
jgi:hypothetical protein